MSDGTTYLGRVIPASFQGVSVRWNFGSSSLISPNEVSFDLYNGDSFFDASDIAGAEVMITYALVSDYETEVLRKWRFYVRDALPAYGVIRVYCENYMSQYLEGDYPNTYHPKEVWPSRDIDEEGLDDYCVPIVFGDEAFVPIMSVNTGSDRYYVMGYGTTPTYTITRVQSPRGWPTSWWDHESDISEIDKLYLGAATGGTFYLSVSARAEYQNLYLGTPVGGTFDIGKVGDMATVVFNTSAATLHTALEGVFGAGTVTVSAATDFGIEFSLAAGESGLTVDFSGLSGQVNPELSVSATYLSGGSRTYASGVTATSIQNGLNAIYGSGVTVVYTGDTAATTLTVTVSGEQRVWTVPDDVYSLSVETWGGGGSGAGGDNTWGNSYGTGGGGGAYSKRAFDVVPGQQVDYYIAPSVLGQFEDGTDGGDTWFLENDVDGCVARGGKAGIYGLGEEDPPSGGDGGLASAGYGDTKYNGGNGALGTARTTGFPPAIWSYYGGGGGGGAGSTGNGNNASNSTPGAAKSENGGAGGAGSTTSGGASGGDGSTYGGGGGGGNITGTGGDGAQGLLKITYGGDILFYITFDTSIGISGVTANFAGLTGETGTPSLEITQAYDDNKIYDFNQTSASGYKLAQFIIHDSDGDGIEDANGLWSKGDTFDLPLVRFSRSDTEDLDTPSEVAEFVLKDFGMADADLDTQTFDEATATFVDRDVYFSGGLWKKESREKVLSAILSQCDGYLYEADTVEFHLFAADSVETITTAKTARLSFKASPKSRNKNDGGRVAWREYGYPQDVLTGKAVVPLYEDQTSIANPAKEALECSFMTNSQHAQRAAMLHFAKKMLVEGADSFSVPVTMLSTVKTLIPGHVLTVNDTMFGDSHDIVVTGIDFTKEGLVKITGNRMTYIEDWDDLTRETITIAEAGTGGWKVFTSSELLVQTNTPTDDVVADLDSGTFYRTDAGVVMIKI